jgi:hypothetical protein
MWDEDDCQRRRVGRAELVSSWGMVGAIVLGLAAWSAIRTLTTDAIQPIRAGSDRMGPDATQPALQPIEPVASSSVADRKVGEH